MYAFEWHKKPIRANSSGDTFLCSIDLSIIYILQCIVQTICLRIKEATSSYQCLFIYGVLYY